MNFNVTVVALEGSTIHHAFDEVRDSLAWSLSALGHKVSVTENWFSEHGETNIILGTELMAEFTEIPRNSIIFNLEQISHPRMEAVRKLSQGLKVWDFSLSNRDDWRKRGFDCDHVPVGYTPNLTRIPTDRHKDIDVFFAGFLTPRRREFLDSLTGLKVVTAGSACYGGVRDELISRSKVCLNIHHDGRDQFEIVRCSYLMANHACVVTEPSSDDAEYEDFKGGLVRVPIRIMRDYIHSLVKSDPERESIGNMGCAVIKRLDFTAVVEAALVGVTANTMSRPMQRKIERAQQKQEYLQQGRELKKKGDERVINRYYRACVEGDMKDFSPYLLSIAKGNILEIGVRDGASTSAFLLGLEENGGSLTSMDINDCYHLFEGHPQWIFFKIDSHNAVVIDSTFDIVFVDGDHSRQGFRDDLEKAWRWSKPGGLILCHDIVTKPGWTLEEHPGSDLPSKHIRDEYFAFCEHMNCEHTEDERWPGLGTITKKVKEVVDSDESWDASKKILEALS